MATCIITNCRGYAPSDEPFCAKHRDKPAKQVPAVAAVIEAARDLVMKPGGLRNNGQALVVIEKADKSDPHYRLCTALEQLDALAANPVPGDAGGAAATALEKLAHEHGSIIVSWMGDKLAYKAHDIAWTPLEAALAHAAPAPSDGADLAADVVRLVIAAREVAFGGMFDSDDPDKRSAIRELDQASEAFASSVPWEDEPEEESAPARSFGECQHCADTHRPLEGGYCEPCRRKLGDMALAYHRATTCPCTAAERYVETCPKHGNPTPAKAEAGVPAGMVLVPADDDKRDFADSILPEAMIDAGIVVLDQVQADGANYVPGVTTDWDDGMVAVAIYRAMLAAAPKQATPTDEAVREAWRSAVEHAEATCSGIAARYEYGSPENNVARNCCDAVGALALLKARSAPGSGVGEAEE